MVAEALNLRLVDAETINQAAETSGVPQMALAEMEHEGERGLANQVLKALRTMPSLSSVGESGATYPDLSSLHLPFTGLFSPTVRPLSASLEGYVHMVDLVIRGLAQEGNVLIVGRGGQAILKKHPSATHIQIVAPLNYRVDVLIARHELNKRTAQNRIRTSDRSRFDYVRRYHDADWLDPTLYHLTINTARVPVAKAVELIIAAEKTETLPSDQDVANE